MYPKGTHRKVSRRAFLRACFSGLGISLVAACGTSSSSTPPATSLSAPTLTLPEGITASAAQPTAAPLPLPVGTAGKLTVIHRTEFFEAVQTRFRNLVTEYANAKGVELDISTANPTRFGDFNTKMLAAVQAGNPPDVAYHSLPIAQLYALDIVEDVSDVVAESIQLYGDVVPLAAKQNLRFDGKWWGVPFMSTTGAWFGRTDIFEAAGIDVNTLDTFDKRRAAALKISEPSKDIWGWGLTINKSADGESLIMDVIQAFGGSITDGSGHRVIFHSPQTIQAVKWLQETYTGDMYKPMLPPGIESWNDPSNNEVYLAGKLALTQNGFSLYAQANKDRNPISAKTVVLHKPKTNDGKLLEAGGGGWFTIFKGARNIRVAKQLIHHLLDPQNFTAMVREGGGMFLPAYKNLWTDNILTLDPNFAMLKEIIFNPMPYTGFAYPADPSAAIDAVIAVSIPSQMMANITSGRMSAEQAVKDAHDRIVQIFEEAGLPQR